MIKKAFIIFAGILIVFVSFQIISNTISNSLSIIQQKALRQIGTSFASEQIDYKSWLWDTDKTFSYDVIYMNIFSPGMAVFSLKKANILDGQSGYILEANLNEDDLFKKIYSAQMKASSQITGDTKVPLVYREITITPEKEKAKEIRFYPSEKIAESEGSKFKIPDKTYDPLSVFFGFLGSEFVIDKPIVLNLLSKEEVYEFRATPKALDNDIYRLEGEVFRKDRSSAHGARFTIWVLNGRVRVPLLIRVISAAGPIYLRLNSVN